MNYTLRRFILRILIPFLVVAALAMTARFIMVRDFNEARVSIPDGDGASSREHYYSPLEPKELPYSEANKEQVLNSLRMSMSRLESSLERRSSVSLEESKELENAVAEFEATLEELKQANADTWESRLDAAFEELNEFATSIGLAIDGDRG